jgi:hypothetical protein
VSKPTLIKWNRQFRGQIDSLQDQEFQGMVERFRIARQHRVERFVQQIDRLEHELESRELDTVQTERLLRLWVRMMESVRAEIDPRQLDVTVQESPMQIWERIVSQCVTPDGVMSEAQKRMMESAPDGMPLP